MSEWQLISTYNKLSGTKVLLAQDDIVDAGQWVSDIQGHYETVSCSKGRRVQVWREYDSGYWSPDDIFDPTHWMPLPDPPACFGKNVA
jgi:hypothetical protein